MKSVDVFNEFCLLDVMLMQLLRKPFFLKKKGMVMSHYFVSPVLHFKAELKSLCFEDVGVQNLSLIIQNESH